MSQKSMLERYLERYPLAPSRRGTGLDRELIDRWVFQVQMHGDAPVKAQIAHAKRTATSLVKAKNNFKNLSPAQLKQLSDTAAMMRDLAESLQPLALWAKRYKEFFDKTHISDQIESCDAFAQKRWNGDEVDFQLELELLMEANNTKTRSCVGDWFHLNKRYTNVSADQFFCSINVHIQEGQSVKERMRAVAHAFLYDAIRSANSSLYADGLSVFVGEKDLDLYLAYRKSKVQESASAAWNKLGVKP